MAKLKASMNETKAQPDFIRGRAMVEPKNKAELIKKRLCTRVIDFHLSIDILPALKNKDSLSPATQPFNSRGFCFTELFLAPSN